MMSARRPPSSIERFLVLVLVGFITIDLLLVVPAFASELRLDRLHPSLPIVNLRPLAAGRARIADGLGGEFTAPIRAIAGDLQQAGAKALNAILYEEDAAPGNPAEATEGTTNPNNEGNDSAGVALVPSATPYPGSNNTPLPSPTVDSVETSVVQTATSLALPPKTKTPAATSTQIPSYTPTSTGTQSQQDPSMTPSQIAVLTATIAHTVSPTPVWQATIDPTFTPTFQASSTPTRTTAPPTSTPTTVPTPLPTHTQTAIPAPTNSGLVPAFPGAQGWGAGSAGGRGGWVIEVTNLNDSGPGSLRAAVEASGPRIVVFRVAGVIKLESALWLTEPYITIAGQTAPGSGITLEGERLKVTTHDVIIRYLRWRGGSASFLTLRPWDDLHDVIVDHCSATWGEDDIVDIWFGRGDEADPDVQNITIQNCLIAEPLAVQPTGMLAGGSWTESFDYINRIHHISIHHNLFVHIQYRNPRLKTLYSEVINNVVYNWGNRIGGSSRGSEVDWIGNYFKAGPMTSSGNDHHLRHESVDYHDWDVVYPFASIYFEGNVSPFTGYSDPNVDNWAMITEYGGPNKGAVISENHRRYTPLDPAPFPITIQSAFDAYGHVISNAGANARLDSLGNWVLNPDTVDQRLISEVQNGTGPSHYSEIETVGDIGPIDLGAPYDDSDHDGMADEWELVYCFEPNDPSDGPRDADGDGYTNVEEFLNGTRPVASEDC